MFVLPTTHRPAAVILAYAYNDLITAAANVVALHDLVTEFAGYIDVVLATGFGPAFNAGGAYTVHDWAGQ